MNHTGILGAKISRRTVFVMMWLAIFALGIFFRTYHFHDWLQFSPDEVRDAMVVRNVLEGKAALPLLGPIAGGTNFHLGPIFYYFEYAAASIFGNAPDKMAYFDLMTSIASVPLLLLFLRRYFRTDIALALSALMSVSYFLVYISRFASNPNSIPFFTLLFLFATLRMMEERDGRRFLWPVLIGTAIGVGVQLHTLLLLIMPTVTVIVWGILLARKRSFWRGALLVLAVSVLFNVPQIVSEVRTNASNVQEFLKSSDTQSGGRGKFFDNAVTVVSCQIQANAEIVSSVENIKVCGDMFDVGRAMKKYQDTPGVIHSPWLFELAMVASVLFSIAGYLLVWYGYRREVDPSRKDFLSLFLVYNTVTALFFMPVASHMELRYYVIVFFVPFVLLGCILSFVMEHMPKRRHPGVLAVVLLLIVLNVAVVWKASTAYREHRASDGDNAILGEVEVMTRYIADHAPSKAVAVTGEKAYVRRFFPAFSYLLDRSGIVVSQPKDASDLSEGMVRFDVAAAHSKKRRQPDAVSGDAGTVRKQFGNVMLTIIR